MAKERVRETYLIDDVEDATARLDAAIDFTRTSKAPEVKTFAKSVRL
jgi:hypothetical protein